MPAAAPLGIGCLPAAAAEALPASDSTEGPGTECAALVALESGKYYRDCASRYPADYEWQRACADGAMGSAMVGGTLCTLKVMGDVLDCADLNC